jgi:hypothetical protein
MATWQLVQNNTVSNALLALFLAGVVPGTHKVLSPDLVMSVTLVILVLGGLVLFKRSNNKTRRPSPLHIDLLDPQLPAVAVSSLRPANLILPSRKRRAILLRLAWLRHRLALLNKLAEKKLSAFATLAKLGFWRLRQSLHAYFRAAHRTTSVLATRVWLKTRQATISLWRWLLPYLWQFDGWLEKQTLRFLAWQRKKMHRHDKTLFFITICRELAKSIKLFWQRNVWVYIKPIFVTKDSSNDE